MTDYKGRNLSDHILDYLIASLDDSNDFSWQAAETSHAVLLCRMEQGEVTSWSQTDKIDRIRLANAQQHVIPPSQITEFSKKTGISKICQVNALCLL